MWTAATDLPDPMMVSTSLANLPLRLFSLFWSVQTNPSVPTEASPTKPVSAGGLSAR